MPQAAVTPTMVAAPAPALRLPLMRIIMVGSSRRGLADRSWSDGGGR
jgi:hypothetical protein